MGKKCHDIHAIYACSACHDIIDGRSAVVVLSQVILRDYILDALEETQLIMLEEGLIKV
jgi:hypothetical protein